MIRVMRVLQISALLFICASCAAQDLIWHSPAASESQARDLLKGVCPHSIETDRGVPDSFLGCKPCPPSPWWARIHQWPPGNRSISTAYFMAASPPPEWRKPQRAS